MAMRRSSVVGWRPGRARLALVAIVLLSAPAAHATVYSWRGDGGVLMMSNDPADVPKDEQVSAQQYTAKPAPRPAPVDDAPPGAEPAPADAYRRGFEAGLESADREVALAGEMARTMLAAVPQAPPAPPTIIYQAPPPVAPAAAYGSPPYAPYAPPPYYGYGYGAPYPFPYAFAVSVVPHRHFPGSHGRRFASFPNGPFSSSYPNGPFSRSGIGGMR